ncbi:hypothetical protein [Asticcacaulis solisilvae]|uniref:hypothetical protein n=1 Tax=Asticcacaulis solisilvae TaxID=1217274 RepID=UPI003FD8B407
MKALLGIINTAGITFVMTWPFAMAVFGKRPLFRGLSLLHGIILVLVLLAIAKARKT